MQTFVNIISFPFKILIEITRNDQCPIFFSRIAPNSSKNYLAYKRLKQKPFRRCLKTKNAKKNYNEIRVKFVKLNAVNTK